MFGFGLMFNMSVSSVGLCAYDTIVHLSRSNNLIAITNALNEISSNECFNMLIKRNLKKSKFRVCSHVPQIIYIILELHLTLHIYIHTTE